MMKYFILFSFLVNSAFATVIDNFKDNLSPRLEEFKQINSLDKSDIFEHSIIKDSMVGQSLSSEEFKKMTPVNVDDFRVKIDQKYIDNLIASATKLKYQDDSIKIIPNAKKVRGGKKVEVIVIKKKIEEPIIKYRLESVIQGQDEKNWFVIINKKIFNNTKPSMENLFEVIEVGERYAVIKFLSINQKDLEVINKNIESKHKYCVNMNVSPDNKSVIVKLFIGQHYDLSNQRIYDGL